MLTESRESNIICRLVSINGLILEWECADDADFVADNADNPIHPDRVWF